MPDLSAVLAISTFLGLGHACPVSPTLALTARHVVDPRPFEADVAMLPVRWTDGHGNRGLARPIGASRDRDLAMLEGDFRAHYRIAAAAPKPGDTVHVQGYDWRGKRGALGPRVWRAKVLRVRAGLVAFEANPEPGSSGGCVFNDAGDVVGIEVWGFKLDNRDEIGVAVAVWGEKVEDMRPEPAAPPVVVAIPEE